MRCTQINVYFHCFRVIFFFIIAKYFLIFFVQLQRNFIKHYWRSFYDSNGYYFKAIGNSYNIIFIYFIQNSSCIIFLFRENDVVIIKDI